MTSTGRRAAIALIVAMLAAAGWALAQDRGSAAETTSEPAEHSQRIALDEGRAGSVAISRETERLRIWWRDPDQQTWSAPQILDGGPGRYVRWSNVRVAKATVAIRIDYTTRPPWADEEGEADEGPEVLTTAFAVCRAGSCESSRQYADVHEPVCERGSCRHRGPDLAGLDQVLEVTPDGAGAFLGVTKRGYVVWDTANGLHEQQPQGIPDGTDMGTPLLASDGSFRVVAGHREGVNCELTLYTAPPTKQGSIDHTEQATTTAPTRTGRCATTLEGFTPDQLLIHTDRAEPSYLVRSDAGWTAVDEDPTGMIRFRSRPGRHAAGSVVRTGYWHRREVVIGSPDGRRLVAQVHEPGAASWSEPVTVARAPAGLDCFEIARTPTPSQDPFYVTMRCRSKAPGEPRTYLGVHAMTTDGRTWARPSATTCPRRWARTCSSAAAPPAAGLRRRASPPSARPYHRTAPHSCSTTAPLSSSRPSPTNLTADWWCASRKPTIRAGQRHFPTQTPSSRPDLRAVPSASTTGRRSACTSPPTARCGVQPWWNAAAASGPSRRGTRSNSEPAHGRNWS